MEIILESSRFTAESLTRANQAPSELLPVLTESQMNEAKKFGWTEEEYARSLYAQQLDEPEMVETAERLARLVADFLEAALPGAVLSTLTLAAHGGLFRILAEHRGKAIHFAVRESVVKDLFEGGDEQALDRLKRVVQLAVLPFLQERRAS